MDEKRQLIISIEGDLAQEGLVPIELLADKLKAHQRLLFNIGSFLKGGGRRGAYKAEVLGACTLGFVESRKGSLQIVSELPPTRMLGEIDLGAQALEEIHATFQFVLKRDRTALEKKYPDFGSRSRILHSVLSCLPEEEAGYDLSVSAAGKKVKLRDDQRKWVTQASLQDAPTDMEEERSLTGTLYLIEVETGERHVGLIVGNRHVQCYYPKEYEDVVKEIIPGSLVELEGRATLDEGGQIKQIEEIYDLRPVKLFPLFKRKIEYDGRAFILKEGLSIHLDFKDGLWIHEYEPLGILAYDESRAESLRAFKMEFAACWDLVAQEENGKLTPGAIAIKKRLKDLVKEVIPTNGDL